MTTDPQSDIKSPDHKDSEYAPGHETKTRGDTLADAPSFHPRIGDVRIVGIHTGCVRVVRVSRACVRTGRTAGPRTGLPLRRRSLFVVIVQRSVRDLRVRLVDQFH